MRGVTESLACFGADDLLLARHPRADRPGRSRSALLRELRQTPRQEHAHALRVATLPPHHRDPFDRLLIAQAPVERLPILTADAAFDRYDVELIRA